jgi:hypothetical protein
MKRFSRQPPIEVGKRSKTGSQLRDDDLIDAKPAVGTRDRLGQPRRPSRIVG